MKIVNIPLRVVEILVFSGILFALIVPLFSSQEYEKGKELKQNNSKSLLKKVV